MFLRHIAKRVLDSLNQAPVIMLQGARQTGKSTLVKWMSETRLKCPYLTLDNATDLSSATAEPQDFIKALKLPQAIDEVQLVPELFRAIKLRVDENRSPGMFLLTGSANVLLLPRLSESLAGRMQILRLWPLSQGEIDGEQESFLYRVFNGNLSHEILAPSNNLKDLALRLVRGGFPEPVGTSSKRERDDWFGAYITSVLQRDVRELAQIEKLASLPNLLSILAAQTSGLLNLSNVASSTGIALTTLSRYLTVLEATFMVVPLPAWSPRLSKRFTKSKKLFLSDSGLLSYLLKLKEETVTSQRAFGPALENFVLLELLKQASWNEFRVEVFHFRTDKGIEVDFVLEDEAGRIVGLEVKAASVVRKSDLRGIDQLEQVVGKNFVRGVVLYTGDRIYPLGGKHWAVPISALWRLTGH